MEIKRDFYLNKLIQMKRDKLVKIITGPRRVGKSYLLFNLFYKHLLNAGISEEQIIRISLDSIESLHLRDGTALFNYVISLIKNKDEQYYLLLDEIQNVSNFIDVLNGFMQRENIDIYVTGSNSKLLSSDIATEFASRGEEVRLYPLSFQEFKSINKDKSNDELWREYCQFGSMPMTALYQEIARKEDYLQNLFNNTYLNDVVLRYKIKNKEYLREIIKFLAQNIGSLINTNKIFNYFKSLKKSDISYNTISKYLDYFCDAFIVDQVSRQSVKSYEIFKSLNKYYFVELGIRNQLCGLVSSDEGHIMENVISLELKRRGFNVSIGSLEKREYNEKGEYIRKEFEIDFVANKSGQIIYIQCCLQLNENNEAREKKPLKLLKTANRRIIITKDAFVYKRDNYGIETINLFDFLLDDNIF
ncbi:ATP-binding protein [Mycoplasmopsis caviae]|uniref:ATP-binding protein n=1 Tax=Mycoplasmopsis caviae TaxID=55603 RepID=A0A3P8LIF2_9BACT|nr:ATP-binding protein [Mycoplasmopsis caviae]UUD34983.1 ATP-binding protein [Mycoplasmopsis caviae]VDR42192.1 putative ATPase, AAA+ superfamily [Mycoplasmopsis caviae]